LLTYLLFKTAQGFIVSNWIEMKFGGIVLYIE